MYRFASSPSSVPSDTLARKMSPVEMAGILKWSAMNLAWVPLPAPGGPISTSLIAGSRWSSRREERAACRDPSSEESFVVALLQLALDLLHRVQRDADHDEDRGAAEGEVLVGVDEDQGDQRDERHEPQVHRTGERDAGQDVGQVVLGRLARPDPGDEAAVLLHVVRDLLRVEGDRDVEVREEDDQEEVQHHVDRGGPLDQVRRDPRGPAVVAAELRGHGWQVDQA